MKTSVYLPDVLAEKAAALDISISTVIQDAVRTEIRRRTATRTATPGPGVWLTVDGGTPERAADSLVESLGQLLYQRGDIIHLADGRVLMVEGREVQCGEQHLHALLVHTSLIPAVPVLISGPFAAVHGEVTG